MLPRSRSRTSIRHRARLALGALAALLAAAALPAGARAAILDGAGDPVPNTSWQQTSAQLAGPLGCATAADPGGCRALAEPATPDDDEAAALAALGPSGAPEDDLASALDALAGAPDAAAAAAARDEALAILEGDPLLGRPYSGIPLLNWNPAAKIKTVPAGG